MTIWGADEDAEGYLELTIKDSAYRGFAYGWLLCIAVFVLIVALAGLRLLASDLRSRPVLTTTVAALSARPEVRRPMRGQFRRSG